MFFDFNPKMATDLQFQTFPNPNPNFDQVVNSNLDQPAAHDDLLFFHDISNYLMSDEDLEERVMSNNKNHVSENITSGCDDSLSSAPTSRNMCRRIVKKYKKEKQESRLAFRTKSNLEIMDDGFKWRKYGKKMVKSSPNPRNYFKCTQEGCSVKKRVERDSEDSRFVITTYAGVHNHEAPTCVLYCNPQLVSL